MDLSLGNSTWALFALPFSLFAVIGFLGAEFFKERILKLLFGSRLFSAVLFLPVLFFVPAPENPVFYICTISCSLMFGYNDIVICNLANKDGAGPVTRAMPIISIMLFFFWAIVTPSLLLNYIETPWRTIGIIASLFSCVYFALKLRKCAISWRVLKRLMPVLLNSVVGLSLSKTAMNYSGFEEGVWYYGLVQCVTISVFYLFVFRLKRIPTLGDLDIAEHYTIKRFFSLHMLMFSTICALGAVITLPLKYAAISLAENPAYVIIFELLAPLWVLAFYKLIGRKEEADIWSGLGIVISAAALVISTQF